MLCEICKQNQATIHIQEVIKGEKKSLNICGKCAAEKGLDTTGIQGINISEILYKLSAQKNNDTPNNKEQILPDNQKIEDETPTITCPDCNWNIKKFKKSGRLGCCKCYNAFYEILSKTLGNIHKGTSHVGKKPDTISSKSVSIMLEIMNLQKKLNEYITLEEFEKAAEIRDKINCLKEKSVDK